MRIPASVLLCADRPDRRFPLVSALERGGDLRVVGRMSLTLDAVEVAAVRQPDAVVVESLDFPVDGSRLVARLRYALPDAAIVAVAAQPARPQSLLARAVSADRYLRPEDGAEALREAVLGLVGGAVRGAEAAI
jgi:DNA-binding NarL/FixJ family response regulator